MEPVHACFPQVSLTRPAAITGVGRVPDAWRRPVWDLFYIGLTIVVFGVLWLIVKGVERFER
jgi:hypothetical protein